MTTYYYFDDAESDFGYIPVPEDDYVNAILKTAKKNGVKITREMIFEEIKKTRTQEECGMCTPSISLIGSFSKISAKYRP